MEELWLSEAIESFISGELSIETCSELRLRAMAVYLYFYAEKYPPNMVNILIRNILKTRRYMLNQDFI